MLPRKARWWSPSETPTPSPATGAATASLGIISNISRRPAPLHDGSVQQGRERHHPRVRHAPPRRHPAQPGNERSALVDLDGKLIGLTTSLAALEGYEKSVGFAIPMDAGMRRIIESLLDGYEVEYGFLGVAPHDARFVDLANVRGQAPQPSAAMVRWIARNSPAQAANIHPGDCILRRQRPPCLQQRGPDAGGRPPRPGHASPPSPCCGR